MYKTKCARCYRVFEARSRTNCYCRECRSKINKIYYKEQKRSAVI